MTSEVLDRTGRDAPERAIDLFVEPRSVALIGVSSDPTAITARAALYARRFGSDADVTIIRAGGPEEMHGLPVRPTLAECDVTPDVAMVMVSAPKVVPVLRDCAQAGVRGAVVIASGFEDGDGVRRRAELDALLAEYPDFRVIGPNCVGVTSPATRSWLTFSSVLQSEAPVPGTVGLVTQSGALGNGLLMALQRNGVGVSHWFSTGNEVSVGALEIAAGLLDRDECRAVGMFLEGITDAGQLGHLAERIEASGKPVVALRAAASDEGKMAAVGHTGRVIGSDEIARAALTAAGVTLVDTLDELVAALTVLSVAPPATPRTSTAVGIVTVSGATGVLAADEVAQRPGLHQATLDASAQKAISDAVAPGGGIAVTNPFDVPTLDDPRVFEKAITAVTRAPGVDATVAVVTTLAHDYDSMSRSLGGFDIPLVLAHLSPSEGFTAEQARRLADAGVAVVRTPRDAVRALAVWAGHGRDDTRELPGEPADGGTGAPRPQIGVTASARLLGAKVAERLVEGRIVTDSHGAVEFLRQRPGGVVIKADGSTIAHRTELGAVAAGLRTEDEVRDVYSKVAAVCAAHADDVLVQAMAPAGLEVLLSVIRDPEVGVVALLKPGGTLVELGGGSVVLTPLRRSWRPVLENSVLGSMLAGWRGAPALDTAALLDLVGDLVDAVTARPEIAVVEANPVLVHPRASGDGVSVVDLLTFCTDERER